MDWFLYDNGLRHERVKQVLVTCWKIRVVENLMKFQKFPVVFQVKPSKTSNHGETVFFFIFPSKSLFDTQSPVAL